MEIPIYILSVQVWDNQSGIEEAQQEHCGYDTRDTVPYILCHCSFPQILGNPDAQMVCALPRPHEDREWEDGVV